MQRVRVDMGTPIPGAPRRFRTFLPGDPPVDVPIEVGEGTLAVTAVSMGNPHIVTFDPDVSSFPLESLGPLLEHHRAFPRRVNVHVVEVMGPGEVTMHLGAWLGHHLGLRHGCLCRLRGRSPHRPHRGAPCSPTSLAATSSYTGRPTVHRSS